MAVTVVAEGWELGAGGHGRPPDCVLVNELERTGIQ